uniref:Uncharacterized protein n=1 Tax=Schistocephalus solidus TaxID=70667 RepID=A0A0X3PRQ7_SCHSO
MRHFCHYAILASLLAVSTCSVGLPVSATDRYYIRRRPEHLFDTVVVDEAVELCKKELSKDYLTGRGSGRDKPWKWQQTENGDAYFILKSDLKDLSVGANCLFLTSLEIMARRMVTTEETGGLQDAPSTNDYFA